MSWLSSLVISEERTQDGFLCAAAGVKDEQAVRREQMSLQWVIEDIMPRNFGMIAISPSQIGWGSGRIPGLQGCHLGAFSMHSLAVPIQFARIDSQRCVDSRSATELEAATQASQGSKSFSVAGKTWHGDTSWLGSPSHGSWFLHCLPGMGWDAIRILPATLSAIGSRDDRTPIMSEALSEVFSESIESALCISLCTACMYVCMYVCVYIYIYFLVSVKHNSNIQKAMHHVHALGHAQFSFCL